MTIAFSFQTKMGLQNRGQLKTFIGSIFKKEKKKAGSVSYVFCTDDYLLRINRDYLKHDYFTDIITFDLSQPGTGIIDAEIYISIDTVRDNANRFNTTIKNELHRVIFHGILHLCGYKDKTAKDQALMTKMEEHYLNDYNKRST